MKNYIINIKNGKLISCTMIKGDSKEQVALKIVQMVERDTIDLLNHKDTKITIVDAEMNIISER